MAYVVITDNPYMRDFYHWVLQAHIEGFGIVYDKGFEWNVEGGKIKSISIRFPINPYWYELGNKPEYLSSRKIYYYRAWLEYYVDDEIVKIYGEWKQFTSINPMCNGFVNVEAKKVIKKYYSYHGETMPCNVPPEPKPYMCELLEEYGAKWEIIYEKTNKTEQVYTLDYDVWAFKPGGILDGCAVKFPDGFKRYYFCKMEVWDGTFIIGWSADMNGIVPCQVWSRGGRYKYFYKTYEATIWAEKPWLVWIYQWVPNSHFVVWRSTNGDLPPVPPVQIEEYHED